MPKNKMVILPFCMKEGGEAHRMRGEPQSKFARSDTISDGI